MRHRVNLVFGLVLLSAAALAQDPAPAIKTAVAAHDYSKKAVSFLGTVSDDGKSFVADPDSVIWTIVNSDSVTRLHGQMVKVLAQVNPNSNEIRVLCVKPHEHQVSTMTNLGDVAFRR